VTKKIVILGGGIGGTVVANKLAKAIGKNNEITLIDKERNHVFNPSLLWIISGYRKSDQIQKPLSRLNKKGINFLNETVESINFEDKTVSTSERTIDYDYLVVTLGASLYPDNLAGFSETAYNMYEVNGIEGFNSALNGINKGRIIILISSMPFKCPAAPYEAAFLIKEKVNKSGKNITVDLATPEPGPMGVAGDEVSNAVVSLLQENGIGFYPLHHATKIDSATNEINFQDNEAIAFDLIAGIPPHGLPTVLENSPILGETGWVKVDPYTLETSLDNVYALGDVTDIPLPMGKPLPKAGVFAQHQADAVAKRIISQINGKPVVDTFEGNGSCFLEIGGSKAAFASGNFYEEPTPKVKLRKPRRWWHWEKVIFEKYWLRKWL
jgi:sulfide:quinone oxidoreductase